MPFSPRVDPPPGLVAPRRVGSGSDQVSRVAARGTAWRRVARGWYVSASAPDVVEQRIVEQVARCGPGAAVTGWAALRLHGVAYADGTDRQGRARPVVVVAAGSRTRDCADVVLVRERLAPDEVVVRQGVRCVRPERALAHEVCRQRDPREAVVLVDMACAAEVTTLDRLRAWLAAHSGLRHRGRLAQALLLADEHSASPQETRLRLLWQLDAHRGRPLTNRQLLDQHGRVLGVADLVDPDHGVVGEYDGAEHRTRARHRRDVHREAAFRAAGLEVVTAVSGDLDRRDRAVSRIDQAYARAGSQPRLFVVGPPVDLATGRPAAPLEERVAERVRRAEAREAARRRAVEPTAGAAG
ncbi:hypothetical protein [Nocardioides perillae]|uniref:Very-short-patch-repair endonuclease n=1 Tax=Nocardioides perillae TaxID=1119534 RepID=A0A7Y9RXP9_9ACTN|nr:hypothetical protein [Nocardioides perillae]NYG56658.1 very-short-patch-repair endonuclease [Nocardioides perillae]